MPRPRIALPEIDQNLNNYTRAIFAAGMEPVVISLRSLQVKKRVQSEFLDFDDLDASTFDGLLLPGGEDINPEFYGEENYASIPGSKEMDELQLSVLHEFVRAKKPVFGICRGLQIINTYFGGTLYQNLKEACHHIGAIGQPDPMHDCHTRKGSWLEELYGEEFPHNSSHHQGVRLLGGGLMTDSWSKGDEVVESIHHEELPIYGVQWHPERMCLAHEREDTVNGLPVLQFFCRVCGGDPTDQTMHVEDVLVSKAAGI